MKKKPTPPTPEEIEKQIAEYSEVLGFTVKNNKCKKCMSCKCKKDEKKED